MLETMRTPAQPARAPVFLIPLVVLLLIISAAFLTCRAGEARPAWRFDFGAGAVAEGFTGVPAGQIFSASTGYGFDLNSMVVAEDRGGPDALRRDYITSDRPVYFSVTVPEGSYRVSITFGDKSGDSENTVKAESRRLMIEQLATAPGAFTTRSFIVNIRNSSVPPPERNAPGGSAVVLNDREQGVLHWDDKLTLEFNGARPKVCAVEIESVDVPTVYLAGDSTVTDQPREPGASWGQMLPRFLKPEVAVANHAESGETMKSFISGLRLAKVLSRMKAGDYLFIQFGHNDSKQQWPQTYVEARTTYQAYLKVFIEEARLRGATPVLVTSMQRRQFDAGGRIRNSHGDYPEAMREVAREEGIALIDLERMSVAFYQALGPAKAPLAFAGDGRDATHHNNYGAYELAKCVAEGMRDAGPPLAALVAGDWPPFDPARPDPVERFSLPASATIGSAPAPDLASNPASPAPAIDPALPTIFIAGDSTAARGLGGDQQGWAEPFADYFDPSKVNVVNRVRGGRSSRTFITEGLWEQLMNDVKAGDIVLIQFGHNDAGAINEEPPGSSRPLRARGSLPGLGEESEAIDNVLTKQHEAVHTFGWYLRRMIADVQAKGARPIVLSLTVRNIWQDGRVERGSGRFGPWSYDVAKTAGVTFLDLSNFVADNYEAIGEETVKVMYPRDHTHFNDAGAELHAAAVVGLLKGLRPGVIEEPWLSARGEAVEADRISWLNLPIPADKRLPTLFLIGDSTVRNGRGNGAGGEWGWGDYLSPHFDREKINVVNRAVGGLSSRTFLTQGYWDRMLGMMKLGDFVMMQFGHNDNAPLNDDRRARGTIKGVGEESEAIDNMLTGQHEVVHTYGWYLRRFIADARERGATPIVCSLVPRKTWSEGKVVRNKDSYAGWAEQVAKSAGVAFVDLNEIIARRYEELGPEAVEALFADEHTHTSAAGAGLNAECVVSGLRMLPENPLAPYSSSQTP